MSKPVINNRISYNNINGIINKLDSYVNQPLTTSASPTFGNILINGNATVDGNLYVYGNTTIVDFIASHFENNIILLNYHEMGPGVRLLQAGIEIDRGELENYRFIYDEPSKTFRVGPVSSTQPVATREENPIPGGVMTWNNSTASLMSTIDLNLNHFSCASFNTPYASFGNLFVPILALENATINNLCVTGTLTTANITTINIVETNISAGSLKISDYSTIANIFSNIISCGTLLSNLISCNNLISNNITSNNIYLNNILSSHYIETDNIDSTTGSFENLNINTLNISDFPIIGYDSVQTRDLGIAMQRYQNNNDNNEGDVIKDQPSKQFILPSQITKNPNQCQLEAINGTNASHVEDYYNGWWIKFNSQIRQIVSYSSVQKIVTLSSNWTTQPQLNDTVFLYNNSNVVSVYNESDKLLSFGYTSSINNNHTQINDYLDIKVNDVHSNNIYIYNTTDADIINGGSLSVSGGCTIDKNMIVKHNIGINVNPDELLHINSNTQSNILLSGISQNIIFNNTIDDYSSSIGMDSDNVFFISNNNTNSKVISINTSGNIGIQTTNTNYAINIASNTLICSDIMDGYLGINGGNTDTINDGSAQVLLHGNGTLDMYIGKSFNLINSSDDLLLSSDNNGLLSVKNKNSSNFTTGSFILQGGINIQCTSNAFSITEGGAITVNGGLSVKKDSYIGGDVYINGKINSNNTITNPSLTFQNSINCNIIGYENATLLNISDYNTLTFFLTVSPTVTRKYCTFELQLPNKINNLSSPGDCIINISGWTNNTSIIPLFNVISIGITHRKNIFVKFESVNTDLHYLQFNCVYNS